MPFTTDAAKPSLLDDIRQIGRKQALWTLLGTGLGGSVVAFGAAAVAPLLAGPAALCVYVLQLNKLDVERLLNDPPRPDYEIPVRARRRRFDPSFMQSPLESATAEFVDRVLLMSAYLEAAVRADERGQRALAAGDGARIQQRLYEGQRATDRAAAAAVEVADAALELADEWSSSGVLDRALTDPSLWRVATAGMRGHIDAGAVIRPDALNYVVRTGLVTRNLRPMVPITDDDAEQFIADPRSALLARSGAYSSATIRATRTVRQTYGMESRLEPRDWKAETHRDDPEFRR